MADPFPEAGLTGTPLRDLGLQIEGTRLEPVLAEFTRELERVGLAGLKPDFYLATEWGVPFPSKSIAIPFYLARPDLTALHADRTGLVEGAGRADILRYLRHEMGHVVNYAYRLYERPDWAAAFGPFDAPYPEEYTPRPFSTKFVRHLPGWYAQKHPDEDWAETFAVWMTPGRDWRREYAGWPAALAKLEYCDRVVRDVAGTPPQPFVVEAEGEDEEWDEFAVSLDDYYGEDAELTDLPGLDMALRAAFDDAAPDPDLDGDGVPDQKPASGLVRRLTRELVTNVFRWTGHFPERTLPLLRLIARRADELGQVYDRRREPAAVVGLTALVTALAMTHVHRGEYFPGEG
ncbi:MAG: hypothetical protein U0871_17290 [Gemmataceae bacterium]